MFLTKKNLHIKSVLNNTIKPIVKLKDFASYFRVCSLSKLSNLGKRQVLRKNPTSEKNTTLSDQET